MIKKKKTRLIMMLGVAVFLITFQWIYATLVSENWAYMAFTYTSPTILSFAIGWCASLLPTLWMPIELKRPSQLLYWLLYLTVYIPSMTVPYYRAAQTIGELLPVTLYLILGFFLVGMIYRFPLIPMPRPQPLSENAFWLIVSLITIICLTLFLIARGSSLQLVGFADVYDVRMAARRIDTDIITDYALFYLAYTIFPLFMTIGLIRKQWAFFVLGAAGLVLLYAGVAYKAFVLSILYIPFLYIILKRYSKNFGVALLWLTCAQFLLIIMLQFILTPLAKTLSDLIVIRNHANSGLLTALYSEFFSDHPLTYGSHIKGISLFITYPYNVGVPYLIGDYLHVNLYYEISANAHLWATDGIASFGAPGVLIISLLLAFVFSTLDSYSRDLKPWVAALIVCMQFFNLSNIGLFSSFLGGGLGLSILLLALMPRSLTEAKRSIFVFPSGSTGVGDLSHS